MPVWDYKCPRCQQVVERFLHKGPPPKTVRCKCGGRARREISRAKPQVWKPLTLEHINVDGEGPLTFNSKGDLRRYCRKHGLASGALL